MGTPSKGPILRINFLKLPEKERLKILERENRPTKRKRRPDTPERKNPTEDRRRRICNTYSLQQRTIR
jgi:hypothetical protein